MPKYTALTPIKHDGRDVGAGELLSISIKEAESLLEIGAIVEGRPALTAAEKAAADQAAAEKAAAGQAGKKN